MDNRTNEQILHDTRGIIFTMARKAEFELHFAEKDKKDDVFIAEKRGAWNKMYQLITRLGLKEDYDEVYSRNEE